MKMQRRILFVLFAIFWWIFPFHALANNFSLPITTKQFSNHLTLITHQIDAAPVITLQIWFNVGSLNETPENNGISHFIEHLLFKGSKRHPQPGEMERLIESLGGNFNAATSKDYTNFYVVIPPHGFDHAIEVLASEVSEPLFLPEEVERERLVVLEEIARHRDSVDGELYESLYQHAFTVHPYQRPVLGPPQNIKRLSREEIMAYYRTHYRPENCYVVISGDLKQLSVPEKTEQAFSAFKGNAVADSKPSSPIPQEAISSRKSKTVVMAKPIQLERTAIGYLGPRGVAPDTYASDLLMTILGSGRSARLYQTLKEEKKLVLSIDAGYATQRDPGLFMITASHAHGKKDLVVKAIQAEIDKLKKVLISTEELAKAKTILKQQWALQHETPQASCETLGYFATVVNLDYDLHYLEKIEAVTPLALQHVATTYFHHPIIIHFIQKKEGSK